MTKKKLRKHWENKQFGPKKGVIFSPHEGYLGGRGGAPEPESGISFFCNFLFSAGKENGLICSGRKVNELVFIYK